MRAFVRGVLESCSKHDREGGLTGALLFNEKYFVQVMEGAPTTLSAKLWELATDKRHSTMVIMGAGAVCRRAFLSWSVGYAGRSTELDGLYMRYSPRPVLDPTVMTADSALGLMEDFMRAEVGQFVRHADARNQL